MLKVGFKIMPKPRGNFMPRLVAFRQYIESDELKLYPHLVFKKEYQLPNKIYLIGGKKELRCGDTVCRTITTLQFEIDDYIRYPQPAQTCIKAFLNNRVCSSTCSDCRAFLDWRTGDPPDYGDYIAVFEQVCKDMVVAWQWAVQEAYNSGPTEQIDIVLSSESFKQVKIEKELKTKPRRRVKVS